MKKLVSFFLLILLNSLVFSSCYRLATEDDYCVVPTTNNPSVTCEKQNALLPKASY